MVPLAEARGGPRQGPSGPRAVPTSDMSGVCSPPSGGRPHARAGACGHKPATPAGRVEFVSHYTSQTGDRPGTPPPTFARLA